MKNYLQKTFGTLAVVCALVLPASAQIGTYVVPRPVTLFYGTLTNGQTLTNVFVGTNWLNYSGFHSVTLWATTCPANKSTTNVMAVSNIVLSLDLSPGNASGYSNSITGTNVMFTTTAPFTWTLPNAGPGTNTSSTNLNATVVDSVAWFKGTTLTSSTTNQFGALIQIDGVVTP